MNILDQIFDHKRAEVAERKLRVSPRTVAEAAAQAEPARDFAGALREQRAQRGRPALIAEVKARSPSRGQLATAFDPVGLARTYAGNGAAAISVLTDERYFGGSLEHLRQIRDALEAGPGTSRPPLLRKDFVCDPYQVYEAWAAGADAVLLIAAHLGPGLLAELYALSRELGMAALVEVHSQDQLEAALGCAATLVGINNRDLRDFSIDLNTTLRLRPLLPREVTVVSESGIRGPADVARLAQAGVDAVLVGEGLVTAGDTAAQVAAFAGSRVETAKEQHAR